MVVGAAFVPTCVGVMGHLVGDMYGGWLAAAVHQNVTRMNG